MVLNGKSYNAVGEKWVRGGEVVIWEQEDGLKGREWFEKGRVVIWW